LEIHDELAAQIQNNTEEVEYMDGVSSIAEDDDDDLRGLDGGKSRLSCVLEDKEGEKKEEEEIRVDTFRVIGVRRKQGECLVRTAQTRKRDSSKALTCRKMKYAMLNTYTTVGSREERKYEHKC
jgi:hypothetical protein